VSPRIPVRKTPLANLHFELTDMSNRLQNWIYIGANAYDEYTFVPWLNRNMYRRTVDLRHVCIQ